MFWRFFVLNGVNSCGFTAAMPHCPQSFQRLGKLIFQYVKNSSCTVLAQRFLSFLESRVCASLVTQVPCSALVFTHKLLFEIKFCSGKKLGLSPGFNYKGLVLLAGCPSKWNTAPGKINLAVGGIFRLFVIWDIMRFLAGNTPEERAESTYNTQVLLSKNKLSLLQSLIWHVINVLFYPAYIELRLLT